MSRRDADSETARTAAGIHEPSAFTVGADGALWFINSNDRLGRIGLDGTIVTMDVAHSHVRTPFALAAGADGNVWFTSLNSNRLGLVRPAR
jgi:virginiamycin B lyase